MNHIQKYFIDATDFYYHYHDYSREMQALAAGVGNFFDQVIDQVAELLPPSRYQRRVVRAGRLLLPRPRGGEQQRPQGDELTTAQEFRTEALRTEVHGVQAVG